MLRFCAVSEFHMNRCSFMVILKACCPLQMKRIEHIQFDIFLMRSDNAQHSVNIISKAPVKRANLQYTYGDL